MKHLDLTANSSNWSTQRAVGLTKLIKMIRLTCYILLYAVACNGQTVSPLPPYGSTAFPSPFTPTPYPSPIPPSIAPSLAPTIPPVVPAVGPFGSSPRPFFPPQYNSYNNPYYNPNAGPAIPILMYSSEHIGDGTYSFSFSTADGKQAQESGFVRDAYIDNNGEPQGTQVVQGSYAYIAPDGTPIQVSYVADENGFRPSGIHIPADGKALPPVPIGDRKDGKFIDPFNRFDPFDNRYDPYNSRRNNYYTDRINRPYDPRLPYNGRYPLNPYNPLNPNDPLNRDPRLPYNSRSPLKPLNLIDPLNRYNLYRPTPTYGPSNNAVTKDENKKVSA